MSSLRQIPPFVPAQRGIDDHLAGRRQLGVDNDLVYRHPNKFTVAARRVDRQQIALRIEAARAVNKVPSRTTVHRNQKANARSRRMALATSRATSARDDNRLIGIVVPREDRDGADIDS